jgi:hypothetical protein
MQARVAWLMHTDTVWSAVEEQNPAARTLHTRAGFTKIASDRGVLLIKTTRPTRHQR